MILCNESNLSARNLRLFGFLLKPVAVWLKNRRSCRSAAAPIR